MKRINWLRPGTLVKWMELGNRIWSGIVKIGDLVRWWGDGDLGTIIRIEDNGDYLVFFFKGVISPCRPSHIGAVNG